MISAPGQWNGTRSSSCQGETFQANGAGRWHPSPDRIPRAVHCLETAAIACPLPRPNPQSCKAGLKLGPPMLVEAGDARDAMSPAA